MCERPRMTLKKFLRARQQKPAHFAKELGISKSYFSEILNGKKGVSLNLAFKIESATNGAVTAKDLAANQKEPAT